MAENEENKDVTESPGQTQPAPVETPPDAEAALDVYPLRDPSEDPRWALWVAGIWLVIAIGLFLFFLVLLVLGIWYD